MYDHGYVEALKPQRKTDDSTDMDALNTLLEKK